MSMLKSCSKCGKIHDIKYRCKAPRNPGPKARDQKLRSTNKWTLKSKEIREASHWLCAICLEEGIYNYNELEVHHIEKLKDNEDKLLDNYNLICLCKKHHEQADAGKIPVEHLKELAESRERGIYPPGGHGRKK